MIAYCLLIAVQIPQFVSSNWVPNQWLDPQQEIVLEFDMPLQSYSVLIGQIDCSNQFTQAQTKLTFSSKSLSLPAGEHEIVVYQGAWQEIVRLPIKVLTTKGFREANWSPNLQITLLQKQSQNGDNSEDTGEFGGNFNLQSQHRWEQGGIQTSLQLVGNSIQEKALRFFSTPNDAPKLDLAQYSVHLKHRSLDLNLGQVSPTSHRHLINVFGHRGIQLQWGKPRAKVGIAAFHSTSLAGYDNFLGLSNNDNQIRLVQFSFEAMKRPGAFTFALMGMQGKRAPEPGFDTGEIGDSQEQTGYGIQIAASIPNQRLRTQVTWAESDFKSPANPFWGNLASESKDSAYFVKVQVTPIQNLQLGSQNVNFNLETEFERVDPLFQSVGTFTQRDVKQLVFRSQFSMGSIFVQSELRDQENNLDHIPSILKTKTDQENHQITLPTKSWMGEKNYAPNLNLSYQSTGQKGEYLPENGGFNASHIPDQVQDQFQLGFDWSGNKWSLNYQFSYAHTDNRQIGREDADFKNGLHSIQTFFQVGKRSQLSLNWSQNQARNVEQACEETTDQYGLSLNWNPHESWTTSLNYQKNLVDNPLEFSQSENQSTDARIQYQMAWGGWNFQAYTQYQNQQNAFLNQLFDLDEETEVRTWSLGLNISMQ